MVMFRFVLSCLFLIAGMVMMFSATLGVNRFRNALNRIHAAALGDTLGLLFFVLALVIWKGLAFVSWKMLAVVVFFWLASPVGSHMLGNMEVETNENPGELQMKTLDAPEKKEQEEKQG